MGQLMTDQTARLSSWEMASVKGDFHLNQRGYLVSGDDEATMLQWIDAVREGLEANGFTVAVALSYESKVRS